jgi:hypothetical protein
VPHAIDLEPLPYIVVIVDEMADLMMRGLVALMGDVGAEKLSRTVHTGWWHG